NLYLTTQALELGRPMVVALNMVDIAQAQGIKIDSEKLARQLGIRVVAIQANKRRGLEQLKQAIADAAGDLAPTRLPAFPAAFDQEVRTLHDLLKDGVTPFLVRRLLLDVGGYTEQRLAGRQGDGLCGWVQAARQRLAGAGCAVPGLEARVRY